MAIELAAALTHYATARDVADSLRNGFDALTASLRVVRPSLAPPLRAYRFQIIPAHEAPAYR